MAPPSYMYLDSPQHETPQVVDDLRLLSVQVLDHPDRRETFATWQRVKKRLSSEDQARILMAWNKHLAEMNDPGEITTVVESVIEDRWPQP